MLQLQQEPQPRLWEIWSWDEGKGPGLCGPTWTSHWMQMSPECACVTLGEDNTWKVSQKLRTGMPQSWSRDLSHSIHYSRPFRQEKQKEENRSHQPEKKLAFWSISSPSFKSYRYMYVYELCILCICTYTHVPTYTCTEMNCTVSYFAFS